MIERSRPKQGARPAGGSLTLDDVQRSSLHAGNISFA
jgi:hypothetical protein